MSPDQLHAAQQAQRIAELSHEVLVLAMAVYAVDRSKLAHGRGPGALPQGGRRGAGHCRAGAVPGVRRIRRQRLLPASDVPGLSRLGIRKGERMKTKSILDPNFNYRNSASTNIRLTFARERRRLAAEKLAQDALRKAPVLAIKKTTAK
jgi:hypothetical protein